MSELEVTGAKLGLGEASARKRVPAPKPVAVQAIDRELTERVLTVGEAAATTLTVVAVDCAVEKGAAAPFKLSAVACAQYNWLESSPEKVVDELAVLEEACVTPKAASVETRTRKRVPGGLALGRRRRRSRPRLGC